MSGARTAVDPRRRQEGALLTGRTTAEDVLRSQPGYAGTSAAYEPDAGAVERIAGNEASITIEVIWGPWCADSGREVPRLLKILERARAVRARLGRGPLPIRTELIAVDRDKAEPAHMLEGKLLELVPTFIVLRGGAEVGRIMEAPAGLLEGDLATLILQAGVPSG